MTETDDTEDPGGAPSLGAPWTPEESLALCVIIGAALMMRIETAWRIFGYPGLAMLCFMAAAIWAVGLILNVAMQDRRSRKDRPR